MSLARKLSGWSMKEANKLRRCCLIGIDKATLTKRLDQSLLKPGLSAQDYERWIEANDSIGFATLCVPGFVQELGTTPRTPLCVVVSFPHGLDSTRSKVEAVRTAFDLGATEVDVVLNASWLHNHSFDYRAEAHLIRDAVLGPIKGIIECCYLSDEEKRLATIILVDAGWDFVKTSTGFAPGGATIEDVRLLVQAGEGLIKVKAAGGISTHQQALDMTDAGADRIGTSKGLEILAGCEE